MSAPRPAPTRDEVADIYYGVGVLDFENYEAALTHDPRRAIAALNAFHRNYCGDRLADTGVVPARDLEPGWVCFEHRDDGPWTVPTDAEHPEAHPVTWLHL